MKYINLSQMYIMSVYVSTLVCIIFIGQSFFPSWAQEEVKRGETIESILPHDTLFFCGIEDMALAREQAVGMPLFKIIEEEEVIHFLKKPQIIFEQFLAKINGQSIEEGNQDNTTLTLDQLLNLYIGKTFITITHISLGDLYGLDRYTNGLQGYVMDLGLVLGIEIRNPDLDIRGYLIKALTYIANEYDSTLQVSEEEYAEVTIEKYILSKTHAMTLYFISIGNIKLISISLKAVKTIIDCYKGTISDCLAKQEEYIKVSDKLNLADPNVSKLYLNIRKIQSQFESNIKQKLKERDEEWYFARWDTFFEISGLRSAGAYYSASITREGMAKTMECLTFNGPSKGLFAIDPNKTISNDRLKMIPKDALAFSIGHFDIKTIYDLILECRRELNEEAYQDYIKNLKIKLEPIFKDIYTKEEMVYRRGIISFIGSEYVAYKQRFSNLMELIPPSNYFIELNNRKYIMNILDQIVERCKTSNISFLLGTGTFKSIEWMGHKIYVCQMPIPSQPSLTLLNGYVLISTQVHDIKKAIKEQEDAQRPSIIEDKDFVAKYLDILQEDKDLIEISYIRIPQVFSNSYENMFTILTLAGLIPEILHKLPIYIELLPSPDCIAKHLYSSLSVQYIEDDLNISVTYGPIGPECSLFMLPSGIIAHAMFNTKPNSLSNLMVPIIVILSLK